MIGSLNADGTLNTEQMQEMMEAAGSCAVTMHRAFDVCADPFEALKKVSRAGRGYDPDIRSGGRLLRRMLAP